MIRLKEAHYVKDYAIEVVYEDGTAGVVDFKDLPRQNLRKAWDDIEFFRSFRLAEGGVTIEWGEHIDVAPEFLYAAVTGVPQEAAFCAMLAAKERYESSKCDEEVT